MSLRLREACIQDADMLLRWVNAPDSLSQKLKTIEPISIADHHRWMKHRLADPDTGIWIAEMDEKPIGQVRIQLGQQGYEVDIYVSPEFRGRGLAGQMLHLSKKIGCERWPGLQLVAVIKNSNAASQRLFLQAGYRMVSQEQDFSVLESKCNG